MLFPAVFSAKLNFEFFALSNTGKEKTPDSFRPFKLTYLLYLMYVFNILIHLLQATKGEVDPELVKLLHDIHSTSIRNHTYRGFILVDGRGFETRSVSVSLSM